MHPDQNLFDNAPMGIFRSTPDGRLLAVNPAFARMYGYASPQEMLSSITNISLQLYVNPEDREHFKQLLEKQAQATCESRQVRCDGTVFWVFESVRAVCDAKGRTMHYEGFAKDITNRKRSEEALRESERHIRGMLNATSDAVFLMDRLGNIIDLNKNAKDRRVQTFEEMLGRPVFDFLPRDAAQRRREALELIVASKKMHSYEEERGERHYLLRLFPIFDEAGNVSQAVSFSRDITESKKAGKEREMLQALLLQSQKMESVGRLAGGMAHDFNNILQMVLSHAEVAMTKVDPSASVRNHLKSIQEAALRSTEIVRQLMAIARKQAVVPMVLNLNDAVSATLKMLHRLIGKDIDLAWKPGADLWPVKMDPTQIDQILSNLLVNARDAIDGAGRISVETRNATLDAGDCGAHTGCAPGDYVLLSVSDSGCGMDKATLDQIFDPFFTTKEMGTGTGLGLATVYGIVKQNNGFIHAHSEPGQGATFQIHLPRCAETAALARERPAGGLSRKAQTVLLVDDEALILEVCKEALENLGCDVIPASTPTEAMALAQEHAGRIDLLITDVIMPEMNGRDLAERLSLFLPDMKCLFMSGYPADHLSDKYMLKQGVHFLQKPFSLQDLERKMREAMGHEQTSKPLP